MIENIKNMIANIEENREELDVDKIFKYIKDNFQVQSEYNEGESNRAYYGKSNSKLWLTKGFYAEKSSSYDRFGNNTVSVTSLVLGNILFNESIMLCQVDTYKEGETVEEETYFLVDEQQEKEKLVDYVSRLNEEVTKEKVINYIKCFSGDESCYSLLPEALKKDQEVIDTIINRIYINSDLQYKEIEDYYMISPYGGEDIGYIPKSMAHCFMDNIITQSKLIGMSEVLSKEEIIKLAYEKLVANHEIDYFEEKLETYKIKEELLKTEGEVTKILQEHKKILYISDMYRQGKGSELRHYEWNNAYFKDELKAEKINLSNLEKVDFTWIGKSVFFKSKYDEHIIKIALSKEYIRELQNNLDNVQRDHETLIIDNEHYKGLSKEIKDKCNYYFQDLCIPKDENGVKEYYRDVRIYLKDNSTQVKDIKDITNKYSEELIVKTSEIIDCELDEELEM
ncbi:hypothetical protein JYT99_02605 [bacterium AH-315-E09]|nr:hypothetical protein [bacterium AH-315-E09]